MRITKKYLRRIIRESLLTESAPGTMGKWVGWYRQLYLKDEETGEKSEKEVTEWYLPVRGEYGDMLIGSIQFWTPTYNSRPDAKPGWRWRVHNKSWKGFKVDKHVKLLKNDNRGAWEKGDFIQNSDPDFGETMKGEVEAAIVDLGGIMKGAVDTNKPPPAAAALVQATQNIPNVKVSDTSKDGVTVTYTLEDTTGAGARAQLKKLLHPLGFSGFNPGRYHGGGMAGFSGGPQMAVSAVHDQGGRIFANFSTRTEFGEKITQVDIRAEWSSDER